ncbi:FG-GAP-like repeat-containing protein [Micromonospora sp. WMMD1120]|uniref:FG-GAP-like repeat-containing protein n=1 Tax=Micromonospora sp. WMMD1120 TaxID=3016106 RepID=UPI0024166683|nr:FG-GAP-like repeat-containing protein [Micromonospora sp. WMMD1120]MDG4809565.1 FG-GAP-like repeat-containing protein [Micromonospora sp. WMMD1120]
MAAGLLNAMPSQAVSSGTVVTDGSFDFAAKIEIGNGLRGCSGALVNPYWALTAKSCFSVDGQPVVAGPPSTPATVVVGRPNLTTATGAVRSVVRLVPHPDRDVVLVRLSDRVAAAPVPLATGAPSVGEQLAVAGFGRTATEWVPDQLHVGTFSVQSVESATIGIAGLDQATVCRGDLGGPAVRLVSGRPQLVALHRSSWQGGCLGETETRRDAVETRVDDLGAWLGANAPLPADDRKTDVNGDGRDDAVMLYRYNDGAIELFTSLADAAGGFAAYDGSYKIPGGSWGWDSFKTIAGDFNGDGHADLAAMYYQSNDTITMNTALGNADGGFGAFTGSLTIPASQGRKWDSIRLFSGDFNGDGRTDAVMVYKKDDTSIEFLTSLANAAGGFGAFTLSYTIPAKSWGWDSFKMITGDFNGDGRSDLAAMYYHSNNTISMNTALANANGGFGGFTGSLTIPAGRKWDSIRLLGGDYNGDGRADAAMVYKNDDTSIDLLTSLGNAAGGFGAFTASYTIPVRSWVWDSFKTITGDYNGDGRSDLAAMYYQSDGSITMHTATANASGGFGPFTGSLTVPKTAGWKWDSIRLF